MYIDLIIKVKNAQMAHKKALKSQCTKMDRAVAEILARKGFIGSVEVKGRPSKRALFLDLKGARAIEGVRLLSKPSARRYTGYRELRPSKGGYGLILVSTPKGVLPADEARREKVGGQLLAEIW